MHLRLPKVLMVEIHRLIPQLQLAAAAAAVEQVQGKPAAQVDQAAVVVMVRALAVLAHPDKEMLEEREERNRERMEQAAAAVRLPLAAMERLPLAAMAAQEQPLVCPVHQ